MTRLGLLSNEVRLPALGLVVAALVYVGLLLDRSRVSVAAWYPLLCVGLDLVVAGYLLGPAGADQASRIEAA